MSAPLTSAVDAPAAQRVFDLEQAHVLQNYARYPLVVHRGRGCYVYDLEGRRYLDMISGIGVNALGHAHPRIVKVIREQAALLTHCSNLYYHEYQGPLAGRLAAMSGLERVFFANSGTEAVEGAIKMCHAHGRAIDPAKTEIISLGNSFHGRTCGALALTGQAKYREPFEPLLPGVRFVEPGDAQGLEQAFSERTAGIILEWVQGEGGVRPLPEAFVAKARELAGQYNALLVFDEIQCGLGRLGLYFGYQLSNPPILPDVALVAKPLAVGLPLAAILANAKAAAAIGPGMHGSTFGGGALACRVALEFLELLDELLPSIRQVGAYFRGRLEELARRFSFIREIRGQGLMLGIDMEIPGKQMVNDALGENLLLNCTHDTVLRFLPPYILTERDVDTAVEALTRIFEKTGR
ncbi:MAG: acetylornithine/succinylornithine family transaminase [Acidobacteria bacterium]|nr:acetylornithine/succinylornithine family transaminase [Acidobacteriota bacterium]